MQLILIVKILIIKGSILSLFVFNSIIVNKELRNHSPKAFKSFLVWYSSWYQSYYSHTVWLLLDLCCYLCAVGIVHSPSWQIILEEEVAVVPEAAVVPEISAMNWLASQINLQQSLVFNIWPTSGKQHPKYFVKHWI